MRNIALVALVAAVTLVACSELLPKRSEGEKLYRKRCAECHGLDGTGNTPRYMGDPWADLTDDSFKHGSDDGSLELVVREGIFGKMPSNEDLTEQQVRAIVEYLRELRGDVID